MSVRQSERERDRNVSFSCLLTSVSTFFLGTVSSPEKSNLKIK